MNGIYLLLGSNLADRLSNLRTAANLLQQEGVKILNESSVYETEPWGTSNQPWFLNVVLQVETLLSENELLGVCLKVEQEMGRVRDKKWGARLIDIDILYFNDSILKTENLAIPHPGIEERRFTLMPLCEIAPEETHPVLNQSQVILLSKCQDRLDCKLTEYHL